MSNLILFPENNSALVLMSNSDYMSMNSLTTTLMDVVIGLERERVKTSFPQHTTKIIVEKGYEAVLKEYYLIKEHSIDKYLSSESGFNSIAYGLLAAKAIKAAIEILEIGIIEFPEASNLYDSLGEMYLAHGNKKKALENYKKSVELNPNNLSGKKVMEELEGK